MPCWFGIRNKASAGIFGGWGGGSGGSGMIRSLTFSVLRLPGCSRPFPGRRRLFGLIRIRLAAGLARKSHILLGGQERPRKKPPPPHFPPPPPLSPTFPPTTPPA